jgi:hypothetical protein
MLFAVGAAMLAAALTWPAGMYPVNEGLVPGTESPRMAKVLEEAQPLPIKDEGADFYDLACNVEIGGSDPLLLTTGFPAGVYVKVDTDKASLGFVSGGTFLERVRCNLPKGKTHSILLRRRDTFYDLVADNTMVGGVSFGSVGDSTFKAAGYGVKVSDIRFQPVREPVVFGDDFMRESKEGSPWENISGMWETIGLEHPTLSANPFRLSSAGARAMTVVGKPFWDSYRGSVSVFGAEGQKAGVVFSYRDPNNYFLFRWSAKGNGDEGKAEVVSFNNGGYSIMAEKPGGYAPGVWYKVEVVTGMGWAKIYVDEQEMFDIVRLGIAGGRFGLYSDGVNRTYFDDVVITPFQEATYSGTNAMRYFRPISGGWQEGVEDIRADTSTNSAFPALYTCTTEWREWTVTGVVNSGDDCGVAAAVMDPLNFVSLAVRGKGLVLLQRKSGEEVVLATASLPDVTGPIELNLQTSRGIARGSARRETGEAVTVSSPLAPGLFGGAGLVALSGRADFASRIAVSMPKRQEAILTGNATFSSEESMSTWAGEMSDWYLGKGNSYWYRGFFPGDVEVSAELAETRIMPGNVIALGVKKTGDDGMPMNGYIMTVKRQTVVQPAPTDAGRGPSGQVEVRLTREGQEIAARTASIDALYAAGLRTVGETVAGYINGMPLISYRDFNASGLGGYKVAYKTDGFALQPGNVLVTSGRMHDYQFNTAPTDWRVACGTWEVTNRWQCDPRWSFFSGTRDGQNKLILLWNKRHFTDPIRVELYAGIKMDSKRGNRYEYARDVNVSLSKDGVDTLDGYSFLYGGFDDQKSAILRNGDVVASTTQGVINRSMRIHRQWFHIVVEKDGKNVNYTVDDGEVKLTYEDTNPIDAGRVAIWSYDCAIMVSRVRISGGNGETAEIPGYVAERIPRTIYDIPATAQPAPTEPKK